MLPLLKKRLSLKGTEIYQPMFTNHNKKHRYDNVYDTPYVHNNSLCWEKGEGKVFIHSYDNLSPYPDEPSNIWIPNIVHPSQFLTIKMMLQVLELHDNIDSLAPSVKLLSKESKCDYQIHWASNHKYNKAVAAIIRNRALIPKIDS